MKAIAVALDIEAVPLLQESEIVKEEKSGIAKIVEAKFKGVPYYLLITQCGKVNAGAGVTALLCKKDVESLINIGVGGSLDAAKAPLLSLIVGADFVQHDIDSTAIGDDLYMVSGLNQVYMPADRALNLFLMEEAEKEGIKIVRGRIATGDQFISNPAVKEKIRKDVGALSVDMETAAMAQVACCYNIPFAAVRAVSDTGNAGEYEKYREEASAIVSRLAEAYILS